LNAAETQEPVTAKETFIDRLAGFIAAAQSIVDASYKGEAKLEIENGSRYVRVVKVYGASRSAYAFVDSTTGDVLKPSGWKGPAKGIRSNIFAADHGASGVTAYGCVYHQVLGTRRMTYETARQLGCGDGTPSTRERVREHAHTGTRKSQTHGMQLPVCLPRPPSRYRTKKGNNGYHRSSPVHVRSSCHPRYAKRGDDHLCPIAAPVVASSHGRWLRLSRVQERRISWVLGYARHCQCRT
jgi:hypothetical protein